MWILFKNLRMRNEEKFHKQNILGQMIGSYWSKKKVDSWLLFTYMTSVGFGIRLCRRMGWVKHEKFFCKRIYLISASVEKSNLINNFHHTNYYWRFGMRDKLVILKLSINFVIIYLSKYNTEYWFKYNFCYHATIML